MLDILTLKIISKNGYQISNISKFSIFAGKYFYLLGRCETLEEYKFVTSTLDKHDRMPKCTLHDISRMNKEE